MARLAVTGATGFIGAHVLAHLRRAGHEVVVLGRRPPPEVAGVRWGAWDLDAGPPPEDALAGCAAVIHLAALAHRGEPADARGRERLRRVNVTATTELAEAAARAGVGRFVFLGSAAVHGVETGDRPVREDDPLHPATAYAESKLHAESALREVAARSGLETVIVRPPLVYGPGAPGNFERLLAWARAGRPLPGAIAAVRRDMISIGNLTRFLDLTLAAPAAANGTFLVADPTPMRIGTLYQVLAHACGRRPILLPLPRRPLRLLLRAAGRGDTASRLLGDFLVDQSLAIARLGWTPVDDRDKQLAQTVQSVRDRDTHPRAGARR